MNAMGIKKPQLQTTPTKRPGGRSEEIGKRVMETTITLLKEISSNIKQDTLILAGSKDHLVPVDQTWQMAGALVNANSITVRMFTEYENAAEHCQVANRGVVIDEILRWLDALRERDAT